MSVHAVLRSFTSTRHALAAFVVLASAALTGCARPPAAHPAPNDPSELWQRGVFLADRGDDFGAEQYFVAARAAGYPEQRVVRELVHVCASAGRLEQAVMHAQSYLDRNPDDWMLRHVMASILFARGDSLGARFALQQVLDDHPEHAESTYLLGIVLRDGQGDLVAAARVLRRYLELAPSGVHGAEVRAWLRRASSFPVSESSPAPLSSATVKMAP